MRFNILIMFFVIILSGCQTIEQSRQTEARRQVEQRYIDERTNRLQGDVDVLREDHTVLQEEVARLQKTVNEIRSLALEFEEKFRHAKTNQEKAIDSLRSLLKSELSSGSDTNNKDIEGHEHIVESGHTLSAIAIAYGSTVTAIKQANKLNSDDIYVGQRLFIPQ
tara:strand:- start:469 stop:963 length:495 start_codon:yes stop_codon:yes gene_type:complete